jgi:putative MATE family efflux protein
MADNQALQLTTQPIPALVRKIAVPASVGFFFHTMYNVVDTYFGGLISTQALASLSLSLPVFFIIIATGTGISTGATALIGNALGAGNREAARLLAVQGITFGVLTAVFLTAVSVHISPVLFRVLGASGEYLIMAVSYMNTIFLGTVFFMLIYMLNAILNALGETRPFRNFLIAGFLLNIILDPWFIYGGLGLPALGIVGIALATVLIQVIGCVYLGFRVHKTGLISGKEVRDIFPKPGPFKEIARQGFPASFNMLTVGLGIFVITYFVSPFGKEAVAAYGIAMRVEQIVLIPTIGLNIATLSLVAQNNGAGLFHRVQETVGTALRYGGLLMTLGSAGVFALAEPLMAVFTDDGRVIETGATYLRIDALVLYAYVLLFVHVAAMQGIKRPMFALWIGFYRQLVAPGFLFWWLTRSLDFGLLGIWWGIFGITWSAALFTFLFVRGTLKRKGMASELKAIPSMLSNNP